MNPATTKDMQVARWLASSAAREGSLRQPCVLLPLLDNALPLVRHRSHGYLRALRPLVVVEGAASKAISPGSSLGIGVTGTDKRTRFAAIIVDDVRLEGDQVAVSGHLGGALWKILRHDVLRPSLNPEKLRFEHTLSERLLERLADAGILDRVILDRIQVCPHCGALPVYRATCHSCRSSLIVADELVHHFACAHVGAVDQFRHENVLRCPKCQIGPLIVGSDFEYLPGLHTCLDCAGVGSQLQLRGKCTACEHDFSVDEATLHELGGFRPNRLDVTTLSAR
jgi:hypothetical protein